jgi:hypothetical protein
MKEHKKTLQLPTQEVKQYQELLELNESAEGYGRDGVIESYTVHFDDGIDADITLVNTDSGPYLNCVLFDEHGEEFALIEPQFTLAQKFVWTTYDNGEEVQYILVIEGKESPVNL